MPRECPTTSPVAKHGKHGVKFPASKPSECRLDEQSYRSSWSAGEAVLLRMAFGRIGSLWCLPIASMPYGTAGCTDYTADLPIPRPAGASSCATGCVGLPSFGTTYAVLFDLAGNPVGGPTNRTLRVSAAGDAANFTFNITGHSTSDMGWEPNPGPLRPPTRLPHCNLPALSKTAVAGVQRCITCVSMHSIPGPMSRPILRPLLNPAPCCC
jgi:hypothetical protein